MTKDDPKPFNFHGHAVGVGAHFHRLDEHAGLDLHAPTLGASVLPIAGGISESKASHVLYAVDEPVHKKLLAVRHVHTRAHGHIQEKTHQTDIMSKVEHSTWADRVHFDLLSLKIVATHDGADGAPTILLKDLHIKGVQLGSVKAHVEVDEEPFSSHGTMESIRDFWSSQSDQYRRENASRFPVNPGNPTALKTHHGSYVCSVVRKITLSGPPNELAQMRVVGHTITWDDPDDHSVGFGKIILGEVHISAGEVRIALARLQMGCPVGGTGSGGEGQSNGKP